MDIHALQELLYGLRGKECFVFTHSLGDIDSLSSALALKEAYGMKVVVTDKLNYPAMKFAKDYGFEQSLNYYSNVGPQVDGSQFRIVVDTAEKHLLPSSVPSFHLVIDHHNRKDSVSSAHSYVDSSAVATAEIIATAVDLDLLSKPALIGLAAGILSDSYRFSSASKRTFELFSALLEKAGSSYEEVYSISFPPHTMEERLAVLTASARMDMHRFGDYIISTSYVNAFEGEAASAFIKMGADIGLVVHYDKHNLARISGRLSNRVAGKLDISAIMAEVAQLYSASGGGHRCAAGISGIGKEHVQDAIDRCMLKCIKKLEPVRV